MPARNTGAHDVVTTEDRCRPCQHWCAALCDLPPSYFRRSGERLSYNWSSLLFGGLYSQFLVCVGMASCGGGTARRAALPLFRFLTVFSKGLEAFREFH